VRHTQYRQHAAVIFVSACLIGVLWSCGTAPIKSPAAAASQGTGTGTSSTASGTAGTGDATPATGTGTGAGAGAGSGAPGACATLEDLALAGTSGEDSEFDLRKATVGYDETIQALLGSDCTHCHAPGKTKPDLTTYVSAAKNALAALALIDLGVMPPGAPLSPADRGRFSAWVAGGVPKSLGGAATGSGTGTATAPATCPAVGSGTGTSTGSSASPSTGTDTAIATSTATGAATGAATGTSTGGATATGTGTASATITYAGNVKAILDSACVGCHHAGGQKPDLSSQQAAQAAGASVVSTVESGSMPPSGPLASSSKTLIQQWGNASFP
jgi:hypothetical protein